MRLLLFVVVGVGEGGGGIEGLWTLRGSIGRVVIVLVLWMMVVEKDVQLLGGPWLFMLLPAGKTWLLFAVLWCAAYIEALRDDHRHRGYPMGRIKGLETVAAWGPEGV